MSLSSADRLYSLLPAFYLQDDARQGQPLRALMAVLQSMLDQLESNAEDLYDDWFIETCSPWVVPYIGELLGVQGLTDAGSNTAGQRARVANTLAYRRRKGTAATLQRAVQDATNWHVHVAPFARLLIRSQNVKHVLSREGRSVDVRDVAALRELGGPFESLAHRVDVRRGGRYSIASVGLFVWRLPSFSVDYSGPPAPAGPFPDDFTFHPFGLDVPLFSTSARAVTRTAFAADLADFRQRHAGDANPPASSRYCGAGRALAVTRDGQAIGPLQVMSADLDWTTAQDHTVSWPGPEVQPPIDLAVDVERGRMLFRTPPTADMGVHFTYASGGDLGGGPYDRTASLAEGPAYDFDVSVGPSSQCTYTSLAAGLAAWSALVNQTSQLAGRIRLYGGGVFQSAEVELPERGSLSIEAGNHETAFILGDISIQGRASGLGDDATRTLSLNGLVVNGQLALQRALTLRVLHTTLLPNAESITWTTDSAQPDLDSVNLDVTIERSLVGSIRLPPISRGCTILNSIVDGRGSQAAFAIAGSAAESRTGPPAALAGVTLFGQVSALQLRASRNVIFVDQVVVQETQVGGITYSYV
ncbi:MAG TPA: phage tail protein, partial [Chloroflexota bacterium]